MQRRMFEGPRRVPALAAALLVAVSCSAPPSGPDLTAYEAALASTDWSSRHRALTALEAYGAEANGLLIRALGDPSDVISSTAQAWLVRQGRTVVGTLAETLAEVDQDRGLFARIAGGVERHRGKSAASTLWLTLVRGVERERCLAELESLLDHASPRVRSVAVFSAVTLRSATFLPILERATEDDDPLVRQTLRRGLVRLLQRGSYSTPHIDAETEERALDLLEPMLVEAAEDPALGFTDSAATFGEMLGEDPLEHHRERFVALLIGTLGTTGLSPTAQDNLGLALAQQSTPEEVAPLIETLFATLPEAPQPTLPPALVAASHLSATAWPAKSLPTIVAWLEAAATPSSASARLVTQLYARTAFEASQGDGVGTATSLRDRTLAVIRLRLDEDASRTELALQASALLGRQPGQSHPAVAGLREALLEQVDRLVTSTSETTIDAACGTARLLWLLADERHRDLFQAAWEHRHNLDPLVEAQLNGCLGFFGWAVRDPSLVDLLLPYLEEARDQPHSRVRETAAGILAGGLQAHHEAFVDDAVIASWMSLLADPDLHPRLRARLTMLLGAPSLTPQQDEALRRLLLTFTAPEHDTNLRDKTISRFLYVGDTRVVPAAYTLLTERDQVHWASSNVIGDFPGAQWRIETEELVEILDGMVARYGPPDDAYVAIVPSNNYFNWAVQYQIYPPRRVADELKKRTGQDLGYDAGAWRAWLVENAPVE